MTTEEIELLKRIKSYLGPVDKVNAVYYTPESVLRMQADEIERKAKDVNEFTNLIKSYESNS